MESPLIAYRKANGLTQAQLGEALDVKAPAVCKWENGKVPPERVKDVSRVTGIPPHELRPDVFPTPTTEDAAA